jgi:hypothetical protein
MLMHIQRVGINMELGFLGGTLLCVIMFSMVFVGLHLNKPFPWERKMFNKDDVKYQDGDNT